MLTSTQYAIGQHLMLSLLICSFAFMCMNECMTAAEPVTEQTVLTIPPTTIPPTTIPPTPLTLSTPHLESKKTGIPIQTWDGVSNEHVPLAIRPCDEIWIISSRHLQNRNCPVESLRAWKVNGKSLEASSPQAFLAATHSDNRNITLFAHGNMTDFCYAQVRGFQVYHQLIQNCKSAPPTRFVIWAWPSERAQKTHRRCTNFDRADIHAFFLARMLYRFKQDSTLSLIGYSYGSRVVIGALHLAGGGKINNHRIEECQHCKLPPYRVGLIAPTLPYNCFESCRSHGRAICNIQKALVVYNRLDPVMKAYRAIPKTGVVRVLGNRGIANVARIQNGPEKMRQLNVSQIGRRHGILNYIKSNVVVANMQKLLFCD